MQNFEAYERPEEYLSAVSRLQEKILKDCHIGCGIGSIGRKELSEAQIADSTDSLDYLWLNDDKGRKRSVIIPPINFRSELTELMVSEVFCDRKSRFILFLVQAIGCETKASRDEFIHSLLGVVNEADIRDFSPGLDTLFLAARVSVLLDDFRKTFLHKLQSIPPVLRIEIVKILKATQKADYIFNAHAFLAFMKESTNITTQPSEVDDRISKFRQELNRKKLLIDELEKGLFAVTARVQSNIQKLDCELSSVIENEYNSLLNLLDGNYATETTYVSREGSGSFTARIVEVFRSLKDHVSVCLALFESFVTENDMVGRTERSPQDTQTAFVTARLKLVYENLGSLVDFLDGKRKVSEVSEPLRRHLQDACILAFFSRFTSLRELVYKEATAGSILLNKILKFVHRIIDDREKDKERLVKSRKNDKLKSDDLVYKLLSDATELIQSSSKTLLELCLTRPDSEQRQPDFTEHGRDPSNRNPAQSLNENTALDRQTFDQQLLQDYLLAEVCLYAVRKIKFILNQTSYNRENLNKWIYTAFAFLGYLDLVGVRFGNFQLREGFQVLGNILLTVSYLNNNHLFEELDTRKKTARFISSFEKLFCSVSFDSLEDLVRFARFASNGSIEFRQGLLRELEDVLLAEESSIEFRQKIPVEVSEDLTQELKNNLEATLSRYLRGEISSFQAAVEILRANEPFFESSVKGSHVLGDAFARGEVSQIDGSLEILFSFKGIDTDPDSSVVLRLQEMPLTKDEVRKKIQELGYEFLPAYVDQQIQAQEGSTMLAKDGQTNVRKMCSPASLVRRLIAEKHLRPDEIAELLSELGNFFIELSRIASIEDEDIESHEVLAEVASILRLSRVLVAGVRAKQRRINWQISELSQVQGKNDNFGRLKHSTAQTLLSLPSNFDVRDLTFSVLQDLELLAEASCLEDLSGLEEATKLLLSLGFTIEQAKEVLKGNKELIYPSESKEYGLLWFFNNQLRPYLRENGFVTTLAVREALLKFPRILRPEVIFETEGVKQILRDVGFRDPEIKVLFSKYPWFLTQSAGSIEKKIQSLTDTFQRFGLETSIEEIKSILSNRPHVLLSLGEDTQRVTTVKELVETAYSLGFIEEINQGVLISAYSHHVLILKAALQICVALQATKGLSLNIIRVADKIREKIFETYPEKVVSNNGRRLIRNFIGHLLVENPSLQEKQIVEIFVEKGFEAL